MSSPKRIYPGLVNAEGEHNRLGFAIQLCYLRYPGIALSTSAKPPDQLLRFVAQQLAIAPAIWSQYAERAETRREHLAELQTWLQLTPFSLEHKEQCVEKLAELAQETDHGVVLAITLIDLLRRQQVVIPAIDVIERTCSEALTKGTHQIYELLIYTLSEHHKQCLGWFITPVRRESISPVKLALPSSWLSECKTYSAAPGTSSGSL